MTEARRPINPEKENCKEQLEQLFLNEYFAVLFENRDEISRAETSPALSIIRKFINVLQKKCPPEKLADLNRLLEAEYKKHVVRVLNAGWLPKVHASAIIEGSAQVHSKDHLTFQIIDHPMGFPAFCIYMKGKHELEKKIYRSLKEFADCFVTKCEGPNFFYQVKDLEASRTLNEKLKDKLSKSSVAEEKVSLLPSLATRSSEAEVKETKKQIGKRLLEQLLMNQVNEVAKQMVNEPKQDDHLQLREFCKAIAAGCLELGMKVEDIHLQFLSRCLIACIQIETNSNNEIIGDVLRSYSTEDELKQDKGCLGFFIRDRNELVDRGKGIIKIFDNLIALGLIVKLKPKFSGTLYYVEDDKMLSRLITYLQPDASALPGLSAISSAIQSPPSTQHSCALRRDDSDKIGFAV